MPHGDAHANLHFRAPGIPAGGLAFERFDRVISTRDLAEIPAAVAELAAAQRDGWHAVGLIAYEAAPAFDPALVVQPSDPDGPPLLWFGLSRDPRPATEPAADSTARLSPLAPRMDAADYATRFAEIHRCLRDGETYQVNFTFPMRGTWDGDADALYRDLRRAQSAPWCAHLHTPEWDVVSASPELFFQVDGRRIVTRPMKGTRPRGPDTASDRVLAADLASSAKERAENVMIVDLLRNDLGRICELGSIHARRLCDVERYPTVWQMTSTVEGQLRPDADLPTILRALFPCGSVTGAPKVHTMGIIARHEIAPRGVYCGAIGYLAPDGGMTFNVAIRTLTLRPDGRASYPVGSGLVADGEATLEYAECLAKAKVLQALERPVFDLLESLLWTPDEGYWLLGRHLDRLADAAAYFGFPADRALWERRFREAATWTAPMKVRALCAATGELRIEAAPLDATPSPARLRFSAHRVHSQDPFLRHKTTHRAIYTAAWNDRGDADDALLMNEHGAVTEASRANIAALIDGRWLTPPVSAGLLPGTLRAELLASGELTEQRLWPDDMRRAAELQLLNSVRGRVPAVLMD